MTQQTTQVYYLPWACQKDPNLIGWYLVQLVSPHGKLPVPNDEDYNFDPNTQEFYQPEGLEGRFDIDMFSLMGMEVDNDIDQAMEMRTTEKRCKMLRTYKCLSDYS